MKFFNKYIVKYATHPMLNTPPSPNAFQRRFRHRKYCSSSSANIENSLRVVKIE